MSESSLQLHVLADAYELWLADRLLARLDGGPAALLAGAGARLRDLDIEAAIERSEDWLMPHSRAMQGLALAVRDDTARVRASLGGQDSHTPDAIEEAFNRAHASVNSTRPMDAHAVADVVLLRELVHHGRLSEVVVRDTRATPDNTAVRTALWRALHVDADAPPHVFDDRIGLRLAAPEEGWRDRPDMGAFTRPFRASIVARARFVEDLVLEEVARGVGQYVILGAGLDTFAQRRPGLASRLAVFEIDQPGPQAWKRQRLADLGLVIPHLVPVDFEAGDAWWERLAAAGFDASRPAVVASTGVSMYLTRDAIAATLRQVAALASGSTLVMSFMLPLHLVDPEVRVGVERAAEGARAAGTPFLSFFTPDEMLALAREAGFRQVEHVSAEMLAQRYFAGRADGLRPPRNSEELLVART